MKQTGWLLLCLAAAAGSGCGVLPKQSEYDRVDPGTALEIPPELDEPDRSTAVRIPNASYSAVSGAAVNQPAAADPLADLTGVKLVQVSGEEVLAMADTAASVYRRLGLALEGLGVRVEAADDTAALYAIEYVDESAREQRPGVLSRWFLRKKGPVDHSGTYHLRVGAHNDEVTVIRIESDQGRPAPDRVRDDILIPLRDRLG